MEKNTCSTTAISRKHQGAVPRLIAVSLLLTIIVCVTIGSVPTQAESRPTYKTATFSAGTNPTAAKIGDLDGDGLNDIAVVNLEGSLQLFFNNGAGSFDRVSLNSAWPSNSRIRGVDIGDLNNDGQNDIAVAFSTQTGGISVVCGRTLLGADMIASIVRVVSRQWSRQQPQNPMTTVEDAEYAEKSISVCSE